MQLTACTVEQLAQIRELERRMKAMRQVHIEISEALHDGVYTRVAHVPKDVVMVGALMKVPTTLLIFGDCLMTGGNNVIDVHGYAGFKAAPGRKTVFRTFSDTKTVMIFRTKAETLEQARKEFTDDDLQGELCQGRQQQ